MRRRQRARRTQLVSIPTPTPATELSPDYLDTLPWELVCMILQRTPLVTLLRFATIERYHPYLEKCPLRLSSPAIAIVPWRVIRRFGNLRELTNIAVDLEDRTNVRPAVEDILRLFANVPDVTIISVVTNTNGVEAIGLAPGRTTRYRLTTHSNYPWVVIDVADPTTGLVPILTSNKAIVQELDALAETKGRFFVNFISFLFPGLEVQWFQDYPNARGDLAVIHPAAYRLLYLVDLGLVNPALPPSAENPRLKDVLLLFRTWTISTYIGDLLRIFLYVVRINRLLGRPTSWPIFQTTFIPHALAWGEVVGRDLGAWAQDIISLVISSVAIPNVLFLRRGAIIGAFTVGSYPDLATIAGLEVPSIDADLAQTTGQDADVVEAALAVYEGGGRIYLEDGTGVTL